LDVANPKTPKRQQFGHSKTVTAIAFDAAGGALWSGDAAGVVVRWNAATADTKLLGNTHSNHVKRLVVDGDTVVGAAMDDTVRFASREQSSAWQFDAHVATEGLPADVAARSGVVVVVTNKAIQVLRGKKVAFTNAAPGFEPTAVALNKNGSQVAVGGADGKIRIYAVGASGLTLSRAQEGHRGPVTSISYSPDETKIVSSCKMRLVIVWNSSDGNKIISDEWCYHTAPPLRVNWAPDSNRIVSGGLDSDVYVWNLADKGKRIHIKNAHPLGVTDCLFIDNATIATCGFDATTRTWTLN